MQKNVVIIWWTSWFWEWIAKYLLKNFPGKIKVTITWRNIQKWIEVSSKLWCYFSDDNISSVKDSDITIFSVPISSMDKSIKEIAPFLKEWSIVLDVCSIKSFTSKALKQYSPKSVIVIPSHPMFWPYIDSIASQIFVLTAEDNIKKLQIYKEICKYLENKWAIVIESDPAYHDKMMWVVQWLTHYNMFVYWETIKRLWINIEDSMNFVSPIYKLIISSVSRYMNQDTNLYSDIQMYNDENLKVHKTFIEVTKDFSKLVKNKDEKWFIEIIDWTKKYFWKNSLKWQNYTDKVIFMLSNQVELIKISIWKKVVLQSIFGPEKTEGILVKYYNNNIHLDSWEVLDLDKYYIKDSVWI